MLNKDILLSIIIPTRNRSSLLKKTLASISNQTASKESFEVIIVDNGSSDNTKDISMSFKDAFINFKYIYKEEPGLHVGRHAGLKAAKGEILVYADDDIEALATWIEGIRESFRDPQVALVGGNNFPKYESKPPAWVEDLWTITPWGKINGIYSILDFGQERKEIPANYVWGCNLSIRKSILQKLGGFHPDGMPYDLLRYRGDGECAVTRSISKMENYRTDFNPRASIYHFVSEDRMKLDYVYKRGFAQGISDSYTEIRRKKKPSDYLYLKCIYDKVRISINSIKKKDDPLSMYSNGYRKGYTYHQEMVKRDNNLLNWILKDNYLF